MDDVLAARQREPASDQPRDLFDVLLAARDPETGAAFSQSQLRDQMATMIVAGHETTALTMFWSLYLLASAPAEQLVSKLHAAVQEFAAGMPQADDITVMALRYFGPDRTGRE